MLRILLHCSVFTTIPKPIIAPNDIVSRRLKKLKTKLLLNCHHNLLYYDSTSPKKASGLELCYFNLLSNALFNDTCYIIFCH